MRAHSKPKEIEFVIWTGENYAEVCAFSDQIVRCSPSRKICIKTLEGEIWASMGDYVIKGTRGEIYPCKPEPFHDSYEVIDDPKLS